MRREYEWTWEELREILLALAYETEERRSGYVTTIQDTPMGISLVLELPRED